MQNITNPTILFYFWVQRFARFLKLSLDLTYQFKKKMSSAYVGFIPYSNYGITIKMFPNVLSKRDECFYL